MQLKIRGHKLEWWKHFQKLSHQNHHGWMDEYKNGSAMRSLLVSIGRSSFLPRWRETEPQPLKTLKFGIKTSKSDQIRSLSSTVTCWSEVWATLLLQNPSHILRLGLSGFSHVSIIKRHNSETSLAPRVHRWPPRVSGSRTAHNLCSSRTIFSFITLAETSFPTMTSKHKLIAVATEADDIKAEFIYRVHGGRGGVIYT